MTPKVNKKTKLKVMACLDEIDAVDETLSKRRRGMTDSGRSVLRGWKRRMKDRIRDLDPHKVIRYMKGVQ